MSSEVVERLVTAAGIERVVVVDDAYAATLADFLEVVAGLEPGERASVTKLDEPAVSDEAPWRENVSKVWEEANRESQVAMVDNAYAFDSKLEPLTPGAAQKLRELLPEIAQEGFTLKGWRKGQGAIVDEMERTPTLVLFDQDFSREEGGTQTTGQRLVHELEEAIKDRTVADDAYYGILTNTVQPEDEHQRRLEIAANAEVDPQRFVLISKQHLQVDSSTFALRLRTTLLAPVMSQLMHETSKAIADAHYQALENAHRIPPEDIERMVIRGSGREGVWEPDTLVRIFEILQRKKVRRALREKERVVKLTERLRTLASIDPLPASRGQKQANVPAPDAIALQHDEIYDSGEHINQLHLPLELGDLFAKEGTDKRYVLIVQPCDVLVRNGGQRKPDLTHFLLAEVVQKSERHLFESFELPYFNCSEESWFVKLSRPAVTRSIVLDCCVVNADGRARLETAAESPDALLPHWRDRHSELKTAATKMLTHIKDRSDVTKNHSKAVAGFLAGEPFAPTVVDATAGVIEWNCERIGRVHDPYARALLSRFSQYFARDAYLLDLART